MSEALLSPSRISMKLNKLLSMSQRQIADYENFNKIENNLKPAAFPKYEKYLTAKMETVFVKSIKPTR